MLTIKKSFILLLALSLFFSTVAVLASCQPSSPSDSSNTGDITYNSYSDTTTEAAAPDTTSPTATEGTTAVPETTVLATKAPETTVPVTTAPETLPPATEPPATEPPATEPPATEPPATEPPATEPVTHSPLYIESVSQDNVIRYYNEVVLDAEFIAGGNASLVQKWVAPLTYYIHGTPTDKDMEVFNSFVAYLNTIEGFPGMYPADNPNIARLSIYFCSYDEMINKLGNNFSNCDGGVTFWYNGINEIYDATICIRSDIDQYIRNSVILEEIYNGLGPVQDTNLRPDSLIYSGFSTPQWLTPVDELILKLLYHPSIKCGMTAAQCKDIILQLYY